MNIPIIRQNGDETLFSVIIKTRSQLMSLDDLDIALDMYCSQRGIKEFSSDACLKKIRMQRYVKELSKRTGAPSIVKVNGSTWIHPLLFVELVTQGAPAFHVADHPWVSKLVVDHAHQQGIDPLAQMLGVLAGKHRGAETFKKYSERLDRAIKDACGGLKNWDEASNGQIVTRDNLYIHISQIAQTLNNNRLAVEIGCYELANRKTFPVK